MNMRKSNLLVAMAGLATLTLASAAAAQQTTANRGQWVAPRTEFGHPDLQGNWSNATLTPLSRPPGQGPVLTPEQVAQIEGGVQNLVEHLLQPSDPNRSAPDPGQGAAGLPPSVLTASFSAAGGGTGGYDIVYIDPGERIAVVNGEPRSSIITFPANGRVPATTPEVAQWRAQQNESRRGWGQYDHPEMRPIADRCIMSFGSNAGPPMLPNGFYNNNYTIAQSPDHVLIMTEMIHDARIIKLGNGPRLPDDVRPWMGDSWGHWEGETLVIETTNIHPLQGPQNTPTDGLKVIERLTRVSPETILYEFRIESPWFVEPWGGQLPMNRLDGKVYEYACHEGNYAMKNILSGARFEEARQAEAQQQGGGAPR
jgi:hypothetical protein